MAGTRSPPTAEQLLRRLALPPEPSKSGLEGGPESSPLPERVQRLQAARRTMKELAAKRLDVDDSVIDRMVKDADEALRKLDGHGDAAELAPSELFGLEAVIETDGSRPVLFVQDGTIDLDAPVLLDGPGLRWRNSAVNFQREIEKVVSAVGAVQLPAFGNLRLGTAIAIAPGLVLTNRHVLEEIARMEGDRWAWKFAAEIDFAGEHERPGTNVFTLAEAVLWGPDAINRSIDFAHLDLAVLRLEGDLSRFPRPLALEKEAERVTVGQGPRPQVYVVGFPAEPRLEEGAATGRPRAGHEYQEVLETLFEGRFGRKRWAPGLVEAGAGQLLRDDRRWVMSHDASTLGGNSGSCVVDFSSNGGRVVGLHFGGRARVENYAHVVAALQEQLASIEPIQWMSDAPSSSAA
ncbi:hypothetical protein LPLAFNJD_LOCUS2348 [Methylorubrum aminovorans]